MDKKDSLRLENQLCFPLYACAREVVKAYRPHLEALGLTYTQYISMMVLWEEGQVSVRDLGKKLHLDSGTLTPLLKKLESKGYLKRSRSTTDERVVIACITEEGRKLKRAASKIPQAMTQEMSDFPMEDAKELYALLYKLLGMLEVSNEKQDLSKKNK
ncbi:putative MarR family transcriptional regulator [Selenomonas ruminantium subsp. lactilytica TAM6421]|uniref:HTH-type transcriptional regulator SarZ n=2 Tax=Selenomonas ruminantium TaxID=971 RepID=A0A1H0UHF2_SELRU|nr:MarR family transcriptional regulator [Selenomonas ruminantium]BAL82369.1 putative MarR family transcriptional regulator [Selenomonas ruminantium subsp. lactilytica TAM6421]SDP65510.1 DNA-binding transcriptional regulator, MarR family [Selenomonas ruminantium]